MIKRLMTSSGTVAKAVLVAAFALALTGCATGAAAPDSGTALTDTAPASMTDQTQAATTTTTAAPTSVPATSATSATTTASPLPAGTTGGLVILLQELIGATSRGAGLPQYDQYRFALFPDGRAFWAQGSQDAAFARMQMRQADLTTDELELLRSWVHEAQLGSLKKAYPPASDLVSQILLLTVRDGDTRSEVKLSLSPDSSGSLTYPANLAQFLDRLSRFSAAKETTFRPERIEVMVTEGIKQTEHGLPLPPELDPTTMEVAWHNEERVVYVKHFSGSEARRLEELIDAQSDYTGATRGYQISYRPLDVPQP